MDLDAFTDLATSRAGVRRTSLDGLARWQYEGRLVARELDATHVAVRVPFDVRDALLHQHPAVFSVPTGFAKHMMVVVDLDAGNDGPWRTQSNRRGGFRRTATSNQEVTTVADDLRVALVAGATRGAGRAIAVELARSGAFVYATGRSSRVTGPSDMDRPETIEETAELIAAAGGHGVGLRVDHLEAEAVRGLVDRIRHDHGRLDVLVNDIFGGDRYAQWDKPLWEHDLTGGLRMLRMGVETQIVTSVVALPLMLQTGPGLLVEMTDGTSAVNAEVRAGVGFYYDFVKASVDRLVKNFAAELSDHPVTPVGVTPGWLRSERMLENFGVTEATWREACREVPGFAISESPAYVARGVAALAVDSGKHRFAGQVLTSRQLADEYGLTDTDGSRPDCRGLIAEHGWGDQEPEAISRYR